MKLRLPWWLRSQASVYNEGDPGSSPGLGRSPGKGNGNPLQYYCLENPMDRGAWQAAVYGVAKSQTRLSAFISLRIKEASEPGAGKLGSALPEPTCSSMSRARLGPSAQSDCHHQTHITWYLFSKRLGFASFKDLLKPKTMNSLTVDLQTPRQQWGRLCGQ